MNSGTRGYNRKKRKHSDKILTERVKALSFSTGETAQATCKNPRTMLKAINALA